jgi:hypothetical protein
MSAEEVANAFVQHFYNAVDANVEQLGSLYVSHTVTRGRFLLHCLYGLPRLSCHKHSLSLSHALSPSLYTLSLYLHTYALNNNHNTAILERFLHVDV